MHIQLPPFMIPIVVGGLIQLLKIIIDLLVQKKISFKSLWTSGGFPSTHGGITASITTLMRLMYGFQSPEFAIAFCFSFLFWYDAVNVRYEAGQHASYINRMSEELDDIFDLGGKMVLLKERLGHTFIEVVGGVVIGIALTILWYMLFVN